MRQGIADRRIAETPVAVIDFETTGLTPGPDRVVEVSVVRIDPGEQPRLVFDTLVNPERRMAATEIHGITDAAVAHAPKFHEIAGDLIEATRDCVVAAYNVYFDIKFLNFELGRVKVGHEPPHFCLMYMRTMLQLGYRCKLHEACRAHGIDYEGTHVAADDAFAAAQLYGSFLPELDHRGISTFSELSRLRRYKFLKSFDSSPFSHPDAYGLRCSQSVVSRAGPQKVDPVRQAMSAYWDLLKTVLADLDITDEELAIAVAERERGGLTVDQIRALHARAFASVLSQFTHDQSLDDSEARKLKRLHACLAKLGWAPGQ